MSLSKEQLEWIVQEVIRRLLNQGVAVDDRSSAAAELNLADKVVTMGSIDGRLAGVTQVRVRGGAIVTPAVRDELKQRGIVLIRNELRTKNR